MRISDWSSDVCSSDLQLNLAVMNDDGTNLHTFFSQKVPAREKDNGIRFMVFPDNRRIFLGDFIVECATMLDHCENPALLPVQYRSEEHTSELQSLMRISYAVFCLQKQINNEKITKMR